MLRKYAQGCFPKNNKSVSRDLALQKNNKQAVYKGLGCAYIKVTGKNQYNYDLIRVKNPFRSY